MRIKVSQYIKREFAPGSEVDRRTIIALIKKKELPGAKVGGQWFVITGQQDTGNAIANEILKGID